jgi:hypothetical protein
MGKPQKLPNHYVELPHFALRGQMRAVLTGRECGRINFTVGTVVVTPVLFRTVADGLLNIDPKAKPEADPFDKHKMKVKTTVRYHIHVRAPKIDAEDGHLAVHMGAYEDDTFVFPWTTTAGWMDREATVVHESVHAGLDGNGKPVLRRDEEAAARLAAEMYKILKYGTNYKVDRWGVDIIFKLNAEVALERGPGFVFGEDRRQILHHGVKEAGYRFGPDEMGKANGNPAFGAWLP